MILLISACVAWQNILPQKLHTKHIQDFLNSFAHRCVFCRPLNTSAASVVTDAPEKPLRSAQVPQSFSGTPLDQQLNKLDEQARRWGRIDKEEVITLLDLVSRAGKMKLYSIFVFFHNIFLGLLTGVYILF